MESVRYHERTVYNPALFSATKLGLAGPGQPASFQGSAWCWISAPGPRWEIWPQNASLCEYSQRTKSAAWDLAPQQLLGDNPRTMLPQRPHGATTPENFPSHSGLSWAGIEVFGISLTMALKRTSGTSPAQGQPLLQDLPRLLQKQRETQPSGGRPK